MKTNIKMRVTPEQSRSVQEICFDNGIKWNDGSRWVLKENEPYLFILQEGALIYKSLNEYNEYNLRPEKEIDADLFIRTNGTCEEISNEGLSKIKAASEGKSTEYLQEKIINLHKQINKDRATIKNQKEELNKLNLKLQKCISFEEHHQIVDELKKDINFRNETIKNTFQIGKDRLKEIEQLKAENIEMGKLVNLNRSALGLMGATKDLSISRVEEQNKEIEKLKAVIEYLESKVK